MAKLPGMHVGLAYLGQANAYSAHRHSVEVSLQEKTYQILNLRVGKTGLSRLEQAFWQWVIEQFLICGYKEGE